MKTILLAIVVTVVTSACVTSTVNTPSSDAGAASGAPPELWSDHQALPIPVDACGDRAFKVLTTLGYSAVVRNGNYSYGNLNGNRAAVKCAENSGNSFVYFAVAGPRKEKVEELRNAIARTF